ncbi:hypothetical protein [Neisseria elongata]|uniref:hypothetical protein n=1 Tax=Neisseria elongata TaxID=495 RepID=UPI001F2A20C2|nr:hypothetical protein [Neisseria elongata]
MANRIFPATRLLFLAPRHDRRHHCIWPINLLRHHGRTHGTGIIAGRGVGIVTVGGVPSSRRILLIERSNFQVCRSVWSREDGGYLFDHLDTDREYLIIALDHLRQYEPVAYDYVRPVVENP